MDGYKTFNELPIIQQADELKEQVDALRPLTSELEGRIMQKFRLDWNYHSNAIEGNTLDYGETVAFLMHGITAKGKPFKDYLDIKGHDTAITYLTEFIRSNDILTEKDIRSIHEIILVEPFQADAVTQTGVPVKKTIQVGDYKKQPNHVKTATGETHYYASPEETPAMMHELVAWYRDEVEKQELHPIVLAALLHHKFAAIHPFDDGNGRMSRLIMNLVLMQNGFPPVIIKQDRANRSEYYLSLSEADTGKVQPFIEFIAQRAIESLELYIKGAYGEDINEPDDLDKEIALFRKNLEGRTDRIEIKRSISSQKEVYKNSLKPLLSAVDSFFRKISDMFLTYEVRDVSYRVKEHRYYYTYDGFELDESDPDLPKPYMSGVDLDNIHDNALDLYLSTSDTISSIIVAYRLNEFRLAENPFGVELKLVFHFEDYKYNIKYFITDYNVLEGCDYKRFFYVAKKTTINKPYHQFASPEEIKTNIDKIGKDVLEYMKLRNNEPKAELEALKMINWQEEWQNYLQTVGTYYQSELSGAELNVLDNGRVEINVNSTSNISTTEAILPGLCTSLWKQQKLKSYVRFDVGIGLPF